MSEVRAICSNHGAGKLGKAFGAKARIAFERFVNWRYGLSRNPDGLSSAQTNELECRDGLHDGKI